MENSGCTGCGACSAVCPIIDLFPARVVHEVHLRPGFDPWLCCSCHLCAAACPVGLNSRDAMFALRRIREGDGAAAARKVQSHMKNLKKRGFLFPVGDAGNDERAALGLPPIPYETIASEMNSFVRNFHHVMENFALGWGAE